MEPRQQRLSVDELSLLRWLLGGVLMILSILTVFYLDIGSEWAAVVAAAGVLLCLVRPALPARVPLWAHRLAFPAIVAFFAGDLWHSGQLLPAIVRLDLLLILYRGISHRARRDDLQIVILGLFLIVVAGVLTVSLLFAAQILLFTACALALLLVVTIASSSEGGTAPLLAVRGVEPSWARYGWRRLFGRLREVSDWRLIASALGLFVGVVAVSALIFLAIPRFQLENSLFLERFVVHKAMTGFNDSIKFGDITEITQDDGIAFDVDLSDPSQAPASPYWRMVVLDDYTNGRFKLSSGLRVAFDKERTAANVLSGLGARGPTPVWTFYLESGVSRYLPILGRFSALHFRDAQNYRYSPDLAIVALRDEPASMTAYRIEGMAPDSGAIYDTAFAGRWKRRGPVGLPLQMSLDGISASDRAKVARIDAGIGATPGIEARVFAERAMAYLHQTHHYALSPSIPGGAGDPLVRWMDSGEPGHCELFAGALVMMARAAGIPARVVTGFKGGTWNAYSGNYTIRNSDAHAWTEIWDAASSSWLREDPLAVGSILDPENEKGAGAIASMLDRSWSARLSSLRVFWYRQIVNFDQQSQVDTARAVKAATESSGKWLQAMLARAGAWIRSWLTGPWDVTRFFKLGATAGAVAVVVWALGPGRWRFARGGPAQKFDPVRREAGRWLRRVDGPEALVADLQRLRFGPPATWPRPPEVFRRARQASANSRRRRRAASRNTP
jgi:protein-glutamine gamma-glutamyltransferase